MVIDTLIGSRTRFPHMPLPSRLGPFQYLDSKQSISGSRRRTSIVLCSCPTFHCLYWYITEMVHCPVVLSGSTRRHGHQLRLALHAHSFLLSRRVASMSASEQREWGLS